MGQGDVGIVAHPAVPIAATNTSRLDANDDAVGRWRGVWYGLDGQGLGEFLIYGCFHYIPRKVICDLSMTVCLPISKAVVNLTQHSVQIQNIALNEKHHIKEYRAPSLPAWH
jgi:hypothetical protein